MSNAGYQILRMVRTTSEEDADMGVCLGVNFDSAMKWVTWRYRRFGERIDFFGGNYFADVLSAECDLDRRVTRDAGVACACVYAR